MKFNSHIDPYLYFWISWGQSLTQRTFALGRKYGKKNRDPVISTETAGDFADERQHSGGQVLLRVSLHHTEVPEAKARMKRAIRLILQAAQGEKDPDRTRNSKTAGHDLAQGE